MPVALLQHRRVSPLCPGSSAVFRFLGTCSRQVHCFWRCRRGPPSQLMGLQAARQLFEYICQIMHWELGLIPVLFKRFRALYPSKQ